MRPTRFLTALSGVYLALLIFRSGKQSLWLDEVMSLDAARSSWPELMAFLRYLPEQHPLYYLLLRGWLVFGTSEVALRALSAVFAVATLWAFYPLVRRLFDDGVARIAAVLLCTSPFYLYYGQEARMYTLLCFLSVLSSLLLVLWLEGGSRRTVVAYAVVAVLGMYTHIFFAFLLASHWVYALTRERGWTRKTRSLTSGLALVAVAYLPWVYLILARGTNGQGWKDLSYIAFGVPYTLLRFSIGYSQFVANHGWRENLGSLILENATILALAVAAFGGLSVAGLVRLLRSGDPGRFVLLGFLLPMALALVASFIVILVGERYFIVVFPFYLIVLAVGLRALIRNPGAGRVVGAALVACYVVVVGDGLRRYYFSPEFGKEQWAEVASYVRERARAEDVVVVHSGFALNPLRYYYPDAPAGLLRRSDEVSPVEREDLQRYWLILSHAQDEVEFRRAALRTHALRDEKFFPLETGISVLLLERKMEPPGVSTTPAKSGQNEPASGQSPSTGTTSRSTMRGRL